MIAELTSKYVITSNRESGFGRYDEAALVARGFEKEQIRKYGFAFEGKKC